MRRGGFYDRRSGGWGLPSADTEEPARTERLLRHPFALQRSRPGDAFHQREGFLLFRVNGASKLGLSYRLLVILAMMTIGVLAGIQPLVGAPGSPGAMAQVLTVMGMQLGMSMAIFWFVPDADRVISFFTGLQFLLEGCATGSMVAAGAEGDQGWQTATLSLALSAMCVPIVVVVEMRFVTPLILLCRTKKAQKLTICAAAYMLLIGLRRHVTKIVNFLVGRDDSGEAEAKEEESESRRDEGDIDGGGGDEDGAGGDDGSAAMQVDACQIADDAGTKASILLARAAAAKEVEVKKVPLTTMASASSNDEHTSDISPRTATGPTALDAPAAGRKAQRRDAADQDDTADDVADDADVDGGD